MQKNDRVRITRPRYAPGGKSFFQNKIAKVISIKGTCLSLVLDGEKEPYMFWKAEVDPLL